MKTSIQIKVSARCSDIISLPLAFVLKLSSCKYSRPEVCRADREVELGDLHQGLVLFFDNDGQADCSKASTYALSRGIIIADTKFEFGLDETSDQVVLVDEVLTPDCSRFWPASSYQVGRPQESLDKQYLRGKSGGFLTTDTWLLTNSIRLVDRF